MSQLSNEGSGEVQAVRGARFELLRNLSIVLEPFMMVLGILFLVLLLVMYADLPFEIVRPEYVDEAIQVIWVIFVFDFFLRFSVAPVKSRYLKSNWLIGLSLVIPFIRPLHALQFLRVFHGFTLLAFLGAANRSLRALRIITRGRVFVYMIVVTTGVIVAGGVGGHYFDQAHPESPISDLSESIWWSATLVTTLTHEFDVISAEARLIAFALRLYGLNVFCFFMASIASFLIGVDGSYSRLKDDVEIDPLQEEIRMLRREMDEMRRLIEARSSEDRSGSSDANRP